MHKRVRTVAVVLAAFALTATSCLTDQTMFWTLDGGDGDASGPDAGLDAGPDAGPAVCGNGIVEAGEECDDGNTVDGDGCAADCTSENVNPEICNDGLDNDNDGLVDCADSDCTNEPACDAYCGDGNVDPGEECDDGNNTAGDGCSPTCTRE